MRQLALISFLATVLGIAGCTSARGEGALGASPSADAGSTPVVLELFTSQGCSSCPPADRVLSRLGHDDALRGRVVPLAFHVDYWNYIGWADPFSSAAWSARQSDYSHRFGLDGVYTPQMVVGGVAELNGSDEDGIRRAIAEASQRPSGRVTLAVSADGTGRVSADVGAETPATLEAHKLEAVVVLYESGVTTDVRRGENSGRTLQNDFVVRRVERAFAFEPAAGAKRQGRVTFDLDPSWKAANVGVAAFLQDPDTMRIYGAAAH